MDMNLLDATILCIIVIIVCLWLSTKLEYTLLEHVVNLIGGIATLIGTALMFAWLIKLNQIILGW